MDYGELVKSALWISLRNRYLWFFGFFVGSSLPNFSGSVPNAGGGFDPDPSPTLAGYSTAAIATGAVAALILVPLLLVASGAVGTFNHAYWTLAYLRLTPHAAMPDPRPVV